MFGLCTQREIFSVLIAAQRLGQGLKPGRVELIGTVAAFRVFAVDVVYDDLTLYQRLSRLVARIGNPIALQCGSMPKSYYI